MKKLHGFIDGEAFVIVFLAGVAVGIVVLVVAAYFATHVTVGWR